MVDTTAPRAAVRRLVVALLAVVLTAAGVSVSGVLSATGSSFPPATPQAHCGPGARPETAIQGRVPQRDYDSGRVRRGYRCNTVPVAHHGRTGGFKVLRYTDARGHTCAFYDSTLLFPKDVAQNVLANSGRGIGVVVLDMDDPAHPRQTASLTTPAMLTPHESVLLNEKRGLLGAVSGNPATAPGVLDLYDVRTDCRHPKLLSSTPSALLGHESGWSRDGRTFYAASTGGQTLVAIDVSDPTLPKPVFTQVGVNYHGLRLSPDGRRLYVANIGNGDGAGARFSNGGLRIVDVSEIQDRVGEPAGPGALRPDLARALDPAGLPAVHPQRPRAPARGRRVRQLRLHPARPELRPRRRRPDHRRHPPPGAVRRVRPAPAGPPAAGPAGRPAAGPRRGPAGAGVRRSLLLGAPAAGPEGGRLLDDPLRAAGLRHPRPEEPRRGRPTSTSRWPLRASTTPRPRARSRCPSRRGT